ncbi:MAG TPA: hypothetical protein VKF82_05960 [Candidatus Eremiobacteraceae bacterium]|nr:hypothetical protein [Candidatus Eremiobacteraceae bacterium]
MSWDAPQTPASMLAPSGPPVLRPLSIGELFDRGFTLYFRHILTFAAVLFVATVPLVIIAYFQLLLQRDVLDAYAGLLDSAIRHPGTPPDLTKVQAAVAGFNPASMLAVYALSGLNYLVALIVLPLANAAVVSGVSRAYLGLPVRFKLCYADAIKRWGYVMLLSLLWVFVLIGLGMAFFVVFLLLTFIIVALAAGLHVVGAIIGALIGIAFVIASVGLAVMGYMAFASSFIACVLEKVDPVRAFTVGVTRIFGRELFWRSMAVALFIALVFVGFSLVASFLALLALYLTKSWFLYLAIAQIINVFYVGFAFVLVSLYYYDIRIRREGFDIQLLAEQLSATAPPTPPAP